MKQFTMLLISFIFLIGGAWASDTTKVNVQGKNKVKYFKLNIDNDRTVVLNGVVKESNIKAIKEQIKGFIVTDPLKPIFIIINSPGGSVTAGFDIINFIKSSKIKTYCAIETQAFSMAAILAQYCTHTYVSKYAGIMFHQPSYQVDGSVSQINARVNFMNNLTKALETDLAKQMGISYKEYKNNIKEEWWMTAVEAAKLGIVDGVLNELYYTAEPPKDRGFSIFGEDYSTGTLTKHPMR